MHAEPENLSDQHRTRNCSHFALKLAQKGSIIYHHKNSSSKSLPRSFDWTRLEWKSVGIYLSETIQSNAWIRAEKNKTEKDSYPGNTKAQVPTMIRNTFSDTLGTLVQGTLRLWNFYRTMHGRSESTKFVRNKREWMRAYLQCFFFQCHLCPEIVPISCQMFSRVRASGGGLTLEGHLKRWHWIGGVTMVTNSNTSWPQPTQRFHRRLKMWVPWWASCGGDKGYLDSWTRQAKEDNLQFKHQT